jgi:adenine-specific DNA-methyltransferase
MDASIASRADTEMLYDQPYEENKKIRVTGPFTVESLSPHRVLATEEERPASEVTAQQQSGASQFEAMILDNLRAAGVQNTKKGERLKFTRLEPYAGTWLQAAGEYEERLPSPLQGEGQGMRVESLKGEGTRLRRVAVCIGPEHGTVGPDLVKDAAKEAVQGVGFDLLVVLGFAFDAHVAEEIQRYGKLTVLPARINPDLQMGGDLLKKSGAGNLFMVFGEPDLEVKTLADGKLCVTIKGVDIYDPMTGEIRSSTTNDIACWFIDTDYNGESFFVRHAYFTGADEPYEKLKRALRAEVDEAAWSALYATTSFPFEKPKSGKIAVKVINHYGDEVLKVYGV